MGSSAPARLASPLHEVVGEVVASAHPDLAVGETVVGWADHSDGLAEYVDTAGDRVLACDLNLALATAAVLIQSLGCVLQAIERIHLRNRSMAVLGVASDLIPPRIAASPRLG